MNDIEINIIKGTLERLSSTENYSQYVKDLQEELSSEEYDQIRPYLEHKCKYCGAITTQLDEECYLAPEKP